MKRIVASLLLSTALAGLPATAQVRSEVDRLLELNGSTHSLRSYDPAKPAAKRYALVIGNSEYAAISDLPNAAADATVFADFLRAQGYIVHHREDITKRGFEDALRRILFDVDRDTEVTVFFAGHGFQIGSENYLVPVDADLDSVYDVPFEAVSLGSLVGIVGSRARLQVVILDSCRDNPFAGKTAITRLGNELRETKTGFSSQAAPLNSMLIFSTAPGAIAYDGDGAHSPFTSALLQEATETPDALVKDVFVDVRRTVYELTGGRQVPWDSSTLVEPASFGLGNPVDRVVLAQAGGGVGRGLVRVINASEVQTTDAASPVSDVVLEVDFVPEVAVGSALAESLGLSPTDSIKILKTPEAGRLVLPDVTGFQRDATGMEIAVTDLPRVLLINESVQIPAASLTDGFIRDTLTVEVAGVTREVGLNLVPNQCDFEAGDHLDPDGMGLTRYPNELRPLEALAACDAAIADEPEAGRFHYQRGRALVALRRSDEAMSAFETARDLGHTRAWQALGNATLNQEKETSGATNPQASEAVLRLFAEGVSRGDPYAFYSLGRQFMQFGQTDAIEVEGYDLMMRALEVGHTFAMNELGYFYLDEDGEFYDPERGLRYLRESAAREDIYGYHNMGLVYMNGLGGTEPDMAAARELFEKAAAGGHPKAPYNLARMHRDGMMEGGANKEEAIRWFTEGLERGDAYSGGYAALLIYNDGVSGYDPYDAAVFAAKASALVNQSFSEKTRELLEAMPPDIIAGGTERLIAELGGAPSVNGSLDDAELAAASDLVAAQGDAASEDPYERIVQLAGLVWKASPFRVDLY
ncbi:MAG: caspase family protein [Pseudomonadota bacterium]